MKTRSVSEIINDLSLLSLVESELKQELEQTIEQEKKKAIAASPWLLQDSQALQVVKSTPRPWKTIKTDSFEVGDRVYITNEITPAFVLANSKDRKATVTKIKGERCFILTDNQVKTHRKKKFLDLLVGEGQ